MRGRERDDCKWTWSLRRRLFAWEETLFEDFWVTSEYFVVKDVADKWLWCYGESNAFMVNSSYSLLEEMFVVEGNQMMLEERCLNTFEKAPLKRTST